MSQNKDIVISTPSLLDVEQVRAKIYIIHGVPVMFDFDLARYYGIETKVLKQAVNRNMDSFPEDFMFKLSNNEANELIFNGRSQIVTPPGYNIGASTPYVFTEQGVAMLSAILRSKAAVATRIQIMRAFVMMHQFISDGKLQTMEIGELRARIEKLETMMNSVGANMEGLNEQLQQVYSAITALTVQNNEPLPEIGFDAQRYTK